MQIVGYRSLRVAYVGYCPGTGPSVRYYNRGKVVSNDSLRYATVDYVAYHIMLSKRSLRHP